jgi:hypothetical protein
VGSRRSKVIIFLFGDMAVRCFGIPSKSTWIQWP